MRVTIGPDQVVKEAETEADRRRLAREAANLRALAHPGVVRLSGVEGGDGPERPERLVLDRVAGTPWPDPGQAPIRMVAGWAAAVATVLADLHDRGFVHGAVDSEHILIDERGRPVLCGFGNAAPVGGGGQARADVVGLARLVLAATGPGDVRLRRTLERWAAGRGPGRDSARALARVLLRRVPDAVIEPVPRPGPAEGPAAGEPAGATGRPGAGEAGSSRRAGTGDRRHMPLVAGSGAAAVAAGAGAAAVAAVAAVAVAAAGMAGWAAGHRHRPSVPAPLGVPAYVVQAPVGEDPLMVVGRWDCGVARPAVLDAGSGAVWVFPGWPAPGSRAGGRLLGTFEGASGLAVSEVRPGCDRLVVVRGSGTGVVLPVGAA